MDRATEPGESTRGQSSGSPKHEVAGKASSLLLLEHYSERFGTSLPFSGRSPHLGHPFLFFFFLFFLPGEFLENTFKTQLEISFLVPTLYR